MVDPILRQRFLDGMSRAAATVNVVTTDGPGGRAGVTVSAMAPVSVDGEAPVVLICLHFQGKASRPLLDNGCFTINLLREDQSFVADAFAGRGDLVDDEAFSVADWTPMSTGSPRLLEPLVAFDCEIATSTRVGTHYVITGAVREIFIADQGQPLIFANRTYGAADRIQHFSAESTRPKDALRVGVLSTVGTDVIPSVFREMENRHGRFISDLYEGDQRKISELLLAREIDVALLYDVDLDTNLQRERLTTCPPRILLSKQHDQSGRGKIGLEDLKDDPLILLDAPPQRQYILSLFDQYGLQPTIAYRPWGYAMARSMVAQNLGFCVVNSILTANEDDDEKISCLDLEENLAPLDLVIATRSGPSPEIAQTFISACRDLHLK